MRIRIAVRRLLGSADVLVALGLLIAAVLVRPPRDGGGWLAVVMLVAIALTGTALHTIRRANASCSGLGPLGVWARATVALAASASVLMVVDATLAAIA